MIAVTKVETIDTHDRRCYHEVLRYNSPIIGIYTNPEKEYSVEVTKETIEGKRFVNYYGIETVIGWDKQTQIALGLPFKVFQDQARRRIEDYRENTRLRKKLREYKEMSLFKLIIGRIKGVI